MTENEVRRRYVLGEIRRKKTICGSFGFCMLSVRAVRLFSCTAFRLAVRQELFAGEAPDMRADGISIMAAYEGSAAE